jgi:two-component system, sporulation sensor kinase E
MPYKSAFLDKLIDRLDRLDPESLQTQVLRLAHERGLLEMIFQSIQEGVVVVDGAGRMSYANHAAEQMLGFALESARGRPVSRYLREIDWDLLLKHDEGEWSRVLSSEMEVNYPEHRYVSFYMVPLAGDGDEETGAVAILRDVTREREQEVTVLESERLNAIKLLAAGVAHEIGNPLNALNIHLQLLDREIRDLSTRAAGAPAERSWPDSMSELGELVEVARNEVERLDLIITQFLRAIRPSQPKLAPHRLETVLKEALTLLKQEIQNRKIEVELDLSVSVPKIQIDRDQIKQAFFNIIRNAFQAMPDGGALRISLSQTDRYIGVTFEDTGVGIPAERLARIFEPYHTTKAEGTGLGLMIVQRIVQDHGGMVEVDSKPDTGTSVTILLPLAERRIRLLPRGRERSSDHA